MKSRDEFVTESENIRKYPQHNHPWIYQYKVKSGNRKTANVEQMHYNIKELKGEAIKKHARNNEPLAVYAIVRIMRAQLRSQREDI